MTGGERAWLDALPVALLVTDDSGAVAELNSAATKLLGYASEALAGRPVADVFAASAVQWLRGGGSERGCESVAYHRTGLEVPVELGLVSVEDRAMVVWMNDLRDREALSIAIERASRNERLSSLGRLAASVAHEINNPLSYVTANLDLAAQCLESRSAATEDDRRLRDSIADSQQGAWRVARLVRQLLGIARERSDESARGVVRLADVVRTASSMVRAEIMGDARYIEDVDEELPPIAADETQLAQVVVNLLINAAQAVADAPARDRPHEIRVTTHATEERQQIWVEDTGPGVPEHDRGRVLEPFFTTKPAGVGTGLGLSICADIVARHDGELRVQASPEGGARFVVDLPARQGQAVTEAPIPEVTAPRAGARVLFIDDEPSLRRAWTRLLQPHEVVALPPEDALRLIVEQGDHRFDVVLCDLMMPEVDGVDVYEELAEHAPALLKCFVIVTGGAVGPRARAFLQQGPRFRLTKPAARSEILSVVQQVLEGEATPRQPADDVGALPFRPPPLPPDEGERLRELRALGLLDTPPEPRFDRLVRLATRLFQVPIALVVLVDEERQWFKAAVGLDVRQTSRHVSFCGHCLLGEGIMVVNDARDDERFAGNPLVVGPPGIRFYAGQPLHGAGGSRVGTLCIIDRVPRTLSDADRQVLADLAAIAEREFVSPAPAARERTGSS